MLGAACPALPWQCPSQPRHCVSLAAQATVGRRKGTGRRSSTPGPVLCRLGLRGVSRNGTGLRKSRAEPGDWGVAVAGERTVARGGRATPGGTVGGGWWCPDSRAPMWGGRWCLETDARVQKWHLLLKKRFFLLIIIILKILPKHRIHKEAMLFGGSERGRSGGRGGRGQE